jgi:hypothetical protein
MLQMNWFGAGNSANNITMPYGRLQTGASGNTDLAGEFTITAAKTATYTFAGSYQRHPECVITPQFDIGSNSRVWVTYNGTTSFTANFPNTVSGNISYVCIGRN